MYFGSWNYNPPRLDENKSLLALCIMGPFVGEMTIMKVGGGEAVGEDDLRR